MYYSYEPRPQSRGSRTEAKRKVRQQLGAISDGPPSTRRTMTAAAAMAELVYLASNGKLTLELRDTSGNRIDWLTAAGAASTDPNA